MKHEDGFSINLKKALNEDKGSAKETASGWIGSEQIEKKSTSRSFTRDPNLGHAAGDYEPLQEGNRFRQSDSLERIAKGHENENKHTPRRGPPPQPFDKQVGGQERMQIEEIRSTFGALDHDRQ